MAAPEGYPAPGWMRYHDKAAYVVFALDMLFAFCYLLYVGIIMDDRKMYLPYLYAREWLDLNSYSLLPPFFALPVAPLLGMQVRQRIVLPEGDFYGIIGSMLGLGALSLFDAVKTIHIYSTLPVYMSKESYLLDAMQKGVQGTIYVDWTYVLQARSKNKKVDLLYENGKDGYRVQLNASDPQSFVFLANPDNRSTPGYPNKSIQGIWMPPKIGDRGVRIWTHLLQKDFKCCGAKNYKDWEKFQGNIYSDEKQENKQKYGIYPPSCYCNYGRCDSAVKNYENCWINKCANSNTNESLKELKRRPGCLRAYREYLTRVFLVTFVLMLIMGLLYLMTIGVYIVSFAAMRAQASRNRPEDMRTYSLLRDSMTSTNPPPHNKVGPS